MLQEFKKFALRGNVVDLAIGVIIGAAFGKIVTSMVDDVLMPPIGLVVSQIADFQDLALPLNAKSAEDFSAALSATRAKELGITTINLGRFINNVVTFVIVAFCVFLVVRQVNRLSPPAPPPANRECPMCHTMISKKARRCPNCTSEIVPEPA